MHASTISCLIVLTSVVQLGLVLLLVFWAGLLWGLIGPIPGWGFSTLATTIFLLSSTVLLNQRGPMGCCGAGLPIVSISVLSSTLGSMASSCATLGTAAGLWLLLSTSLGDCCGTGACCVGAMTSRSLFPSVFGSRISCSLQSLSIVLLHSCRGTPVVRDLQIHPWLLQLGLLG
jgi:hypothetical protein